MESRRDHVQVCGLLLDDVKTGDGGVPLPKDVSIEYLNADSGQYETVPNLKVDKTFPADDELDATNPVYGPYTYTSTRSPPSP